MATVTTTQDGSLLDSATWGGTLPVAEDDILIRHVTFVGDGDSFTCASVNGQNSTRLTINSGGTITINGNLTVPNGTAVVVDSGGTLTCSGDVWGYAGYGGYALVSSGHINLTGALKLNINGQPGKAVSILAGTADIDCDFNGSSNNGTATLLRVDGGVVNFNVKSNSVLSSNNGKATGIVVTGGTLNLTGNYIVSARSQFLEQLGGVVNISDLVLSASLSRPSTSPGILLQAGTLNIIDQTMTVPLGAFIDIGISKLPSGATPVLNLTGLEVTVLGQLHIANINIATINHDATTVIRESGDGKALITNITGLIAKTVGRFPIVGGGGFVL